MKGGVRILAGELKGRRLAVPAAARPTAARIRESLFDVWGERVRSARFLEVFAGTGAVGLEAVSRGAAMAVLVESDRRALAALRRTCAELAPERARVVSARWPEEKDRVRRAAGESFDLVFADPPYGLETLELLVASLADLLAPDGEAVLEHSRRNDPGERCGVLRRTAKRVYGDHVLSFYARDLGAGPTGRSRPAPPGRS